MAHGLRTEFVAGTIWSDFHKEEISYSSMRHKPYIPPYGFQGDAAAAARNPPAENSLPMLAPLFKSLDESMISLMIHKVNQFQQLRSATVSEDTESIGYRAGDYRLYTDHQYGSSSSNNNLRGSNEILLGALVNTLSQTSMSNVKILAVGLPAGFMAKLRRNPVEPSATGGTWVDGANETTQAAQSIIKIKVTRISLIYPDVVFHPVEFEFNTAIFLGEDFGKSVKWTVDEIASDIPLWSIVRYAFFSLIDPHWRLSPESTLAASTSEDHDTSANITGFRGDVIWRSEAGGNDWRSNTYTSMWLNYPVFRNWMTLKGTDPAGLDFNNGASVAPTTGGAAENFKILYNHLFDYAMKLRLRIMYGLDFDERGFYPEGWRFLNDLFVEKPATQFFQKFIASALEETDPPPQETLRVLPIPRNGKEFLFPPRSGFPLNIWKKNDDGTATDAHYVYKDQCRVGDAYDLSDAITRGEIDRAELRMLRMICGSPMFAPNFHKMRLMMPNAYERTFLIPVDVDDFLVMHSDGSDVDGTAIGTAGMQSLIDKGLLTRSEAADDLDPDGNQAVRMSVDMRDKSGGVGNDTFTFDQFIVNIELVTGA